MSVLLDTSVVIDLLRAFPAALRYSRTLDDAPVCSEITRVEVLRGVRSAERASTRRFFQTLGWVALDEPIARRAGEMGRAWRRSHPGISTADLVIAASAEELGVDLVTLNVRHFPMFKGLRPPYRASSN
ncbi:MAG: type II toxin-antitoxin system VapC family toxin [Actinomycetota bacterium]